MFGPLDLNAVLVPVARQRCVCVSTCCFMATLRIGPFVAIWRTVRLFRESTIEHLQHVYSSPHHGPRVAKMRWKCPSVVIFRPQHEAGRRRAEHRAE